MDGAAFRKEVQAILHKRRLGAALTRGDLLRLLAHLFLEKQTRQEQGYLAGGARDAAPAGQEPPPRSGSHGPLPETEGRPRILLLLPYNPGDVVMGLMAAGRIKARLPGLEVDFLVGDDSAGLARLHPAVARTHVLERRLMLSAWRRGDPGTVLRLLEELLSGLEQRRFRLSVNFFQEEFGAVLQSLVRAEDRIGLQLEAGGYLRLRQSRALEHLLAIPAARDQNPWHAVDLYFEAAMRAAGAFAGPGTGAVESTGPVGAVLPPGALPSLPREIAGRAYTVLHMGSAWPGKRWPVERWARLAQLLSEAGRMAVFTGSKQEKPLLAKLLRILEPSTPSAMADMMGRGGLPEALGILGGAQLVVSGDTLAMHLSALAGTPCLALFGASNPVETGPYGPGHFVIQAGWPDHTLALEKPHAGLEALRAETVADFILRARTPDAVPLWQTSWDGSACAQRLVDIRQGPHPYQRDMSALARLVDPERPPGPPEPLPPTAARLLEALDSALDRLDDPKVLSRLEDLERRWAEESTRSVIWEAYRIAVNGMSTEPLPAYLRQRKERFLLSLREQALFGVPEQAKVD